MSEAQSEFRDIGLFPGTSVEDYEKWPGVRKSRLWTIHNKTMAHYKYEIDHPKEVDTEALLVGHATHAAILRPQEFESKYVVAPDPPTGNVWDRRRTAHKEAWAEWLAECEASQTIALDKGEYDLARLLRDAVWANPTARMLLEGAEVELAMQWHDAQTGLLCKGIMDALNKGMIPDIKTTRCANVDPFGRDAYKYGYHFQGAFYRDGAQAATDSEIRGVVFIAVEKDPPHLVLCHEMSEDDLELGRMQYRTVLQQLHYSLEHDVWPGYGDELVPLQLPRYAGLELTAATL